MGTGTNGNDRIHIFRAFHILLSSHPTTGKKHGFDWPHKKPLTRHMSGNRYRKTATGMSDDPRYEHSTRQL
jgi:hypothetical protein